MKGFLKKLKNVGEGLLAIAVTVVSFGTAEGREEKPKKETKDDAQPKQ